SVSIENQNFEELVKLNDQYFLKQIDWIKSEKFDIVFNTLHGGNGENGIISAVLEMAKIPFTGSGYMASSIAMDKFRTKKIIESVGVITPTFALYDSPIELSSIPFPLVIKPNTGGSSVGLSIVKEKKNILEETKLALKYSDEYIIEEFIPGREITASIVANKSYPLIEIVSKSGIYDYESKYGHGMNDYILAPEIGEQVTEKIKSDAKKVWDILGMKNYGRIDFRLNDKNEAFCLEANTLPGMTDSSLLPKAVRYAGMDFSELVEKIIEDKLKK
ncbi:MAG: D-alanine--D-alanine ligase, partial [Candidatus Marinimicrobia bacterium]|nr:D-alanine--D-alanine ligase [Candidatus Neomarinimicrobiota bacterium]